MGRGCKKEVKVMSTETRVAQKEKLFALLKVKKGYEDADLVILPVLLEAITKYTPVAGRLP